ncbi:MAG: hypothetical protein FJX68_05985 [Alphaproteobacteria bacterium]|nr:hypothetical protein [Alphaproteobacteria bacterium]
MPASNIAQMERAPQRPTAVAGGTGAAQQAAERDREITAVVLAAVPALNAAMDEAVRAGLIIEPSLTAVSGRADDVGTQGIPHICNVRVYRKLC